MRNASIARRSRPAGAIPCCCTTSAFCSRTWAAGARRWKPTKGRCTAIRASRTVITISRSFARPWASPGTPSGTWRSIEGWSSREDECVQIRRRGAAPCNVLRGDHRSGGAQSPRDTAWFRDWRTARALSLRGTELRAIRRQPRGPSRRLHVPAALESRVFQGRWPVVLRRAQVPGLGHPGFRARPDHRDARRRRLGLFPGEPRRLVALSRFRLSLSLQRLEGLHFDQRGGLSALLQLPVRAARCDDAL